MNGLYVSFLFSILDNLKLKFMKKIFLSVFSFIATLSMYAQNISPIDIGTEIPMANESMKDVSGKNFSIADIKGKNGTLVMFSCNTCPWVIKYQARTIKAIEFAKKNNVAVIIINSNEDYRTKDDSFNEMKTYASTQGYSVPYVVDTDSKVANAFGATRTPEMFLFNTENKLVYQGAIDDNAGDANAVSKIYLHQAITELSNGLEVSIKKTKSVGCTIKRVPK